MTSKDDEPKQPHTRDKKPAAQSLADSAMAQWDKLLPALGAVLVISLISVVAMQAFGGTEKIRGLVEGAGSWAPVVFILLKASTYVFAPLSGTPLKITAGALFGLWEGVLYTTIGDVLGGCLNFWIARLLGRPAIQRLAGAKGIKQVDETVEHVGGWKALLVARFALSSLYDFISYAAGLSNLSFRHYLWVTVVGGIPAAILFVYVGDALIAGPGALYVLGGLVVLVGLAWLLQRLQKNTDK